MKEMGWSWEDYLSAPADLVEHIITLLQERARAHEIEASKRRRQRGPG